MNCNLGRWHRQHGFTLIEILVVLVIAAILVSMAATGLRVFNAGRSPETQARRTGALLQLASDEAVLTTTEVGFLLEDNEYRFYRFNPVNREWISLETDPNFRARKVPEEISVTVELDGIEIDAVASETVEPQLIFFSSGEATPFVMRFETDTGGAPWQVTGNILGQIDVSKQQ